MFKVKPLTNYQAPRYGTTNPDSFRAWAGWLLWRITSSAARRAAALLLVAGLGLGAGGCGTDEASETCVEGAVSACINADGSGAVTLCEESTPLTLTCADYCGRLGHVMDGYPLSCQVPFDAENPCFCEYDLISGVDAECMPGHTACADLTHINVCAEGRYKRETCDAYCARTEGAGYASKGCRPDQADGNYCRCYLANDGDLEAVENGE